LRRAISARSASNEAFDLQSDMTDAHPFLSPIGADGLSRASAPSTVSLFASPTATVYLIAVSFVHRHRNSCRKPTERRDIWSSIILAVRRSSVSKPSVNLA